MDNYLITIDGSQMLDGERESVSLTTRGRFWQQDNRYYISYNESAATGFEGDVTEIEVDGDRKVTLRRQGVSDTHLIIEPGQYHLSHYNIGYGDFTVGIRADIIENTLGDHGGGLKLKYALELNASDVSLSELNITVKEQRNNV